MAPQLNYPRVILIGLAIVVLLAVGVAGSTSTTVFGSYNSAWDGASEIRTLAEEQGAEVTVTSNTSAYASHLPNRSVSLVLSPREEYSAGESERVRRFVENGGRLIIAADFGTAGNDLLADLGAESRVTGELLRDERRSAESPALPLATNVSAHEFAGDVDHLTLNYGSVVSETNATVLVRSSEFAYIDVNRDGELNYNESMANYPVAVVEPLGKGEVVVVSDPSIFINTMVDRQGNRQFTRNLLEHDSVILDYSHAGGVPPFIYALLILRGSAVMQVGVGLLGLGLIFGWGTRSQIFHVARNRLRRTPQEPQAGLSDEEMRAYLEARYPEWDAEQIDRVTRSIRRGSKAGNRDSAQSGN